MFVINEQVRKNKRYLSALACISLIIISITYLGFLYEEHLVTSISQDQSYEVIVKYRGFNFVSSSPYNLSVYYRKNKEKHKHYLFTTKIDTNGIKPNKDNYSITWNDNVAELKLIDYKRSFRLFQITFSDNITYEKVDEDTLY